MLDENTELVLGNLKCIYFFIFLYLFIIFSLCIRSGIRSKLIKDYLKLKGEDITLGVIDVFLRPWRIVFRRFRAIGWIKKSFAELPVPVQLRYRWFQIWTWLALISFLLQMNIILVAYFSPSLGNTIMYEICGDFEQIFIRIQRKPLKNATNCGAFEEGA
jgi:hypothetical protein